MAEQARQLIKEHGNNRATLDAAAAKLKKASYAVSGNAGDRYA
jgi:hypothetical protein